MVNYGLKAKTSKIYKTFGPALGREFWDSALSSIDLVADLVTEHGIDCSFVRGGAAQLGYNDRDLHHFEAQAEWYLGKLDYSCDVVGPDRIRGVIDSPTIRCAVIDTVGAGLHPARYVDGLARVAEEAGAELAEHAAVLQIARHTGGLLAAHRAGQGRRRHRDPRHQRLHRRSTREGAAPPGDPGRELHRRHRAAAGRAGGTAHPGEPDDVDRPPLPQLLQTDPGRPDPHRQPGQEPVDQPRRSGERPVPRGQGGRDLPGAGRHSAHQFVDREARGDLRSHAPHRSYKWDVVRPRLLRPRRRYRHPGGHRAWQAGHRQARPGARTRRSPTPPGSTTTGRRFLPFAARWYRFLDRIGR